LQFADSLKGGSKTHCFLLHFGQCKLPNLIFWLKKIILDKVALYTTTFYVSVTVDWRWSAGLQAELWDGPGAELPQQ